MKDFWRFIKSSGIYFVGTVMTKLISFLLLPLYTSYIQPDEMGMYDLGLTYVMFFCSVLYLDIWSGIMRFMYDFGGDEKKTPINSGIAIFLCSTALYTVILLFVFPHLSLQYPILFFSYGVLMNTQTLVGYIARGYGKNVLYTSAGILGSLVTILFNILLLVVYHMDYSALLIANFLGFIANILIIVIGVHDLEAFSLKYFDKKVFKDMLIFSLPLCVNSVAYWFLTSYNRIVIVEKLGAAANGYYAVAGRFGSMITLFTTCFQMAWQELSFSKTAKNDSLSDFYTAAINYYIKCMSIGLLLLIPAIYIIYPLIIHESYDVGKTLVPFYLFGTILSTISSFLGNAFTAIKKNNLLFWTMLAGSICNVLSIHLLIGSAGLQASNIALAIGFFVTSLTRVVLFKKYVKIRIEYGSILLLLTAYACITICYKQGNLIENILAFLAAVMIAFFVFRDVISKIFDSLKQKNKRIQ